MTLLSDPQFHVVDEGGSTSLECAFRCTAYTLFDYPVIWRKQQLSEWTQVNVMGSLNKPFVSTDRMEVTFSNVSSRYLFELNIIGQSVLTLDRLARWAGWSGDQVGRHVKR